MTPCTCPRCGKTIEVSDRVLAHHDCKVVCPQCLAVFTQVRDGLLVEHHEPQPVATSAPATATMAHHYCMGCGQALPTGANFCFNCGLAVNDVPHPATVTPTPATDSAPTAATAATPITADNTHDDTHVPLLPYNFGRPTRQTAPPASVGVRIVGYFVIAVLLAVLAIIVYAALQL